MHPSVLPVYCEIAAGALIAIDLIGVLHYGRAPADTPALPEKTEPGL
jgi:hypothetical protein